MNPYDNAETLLRVLAAPRRNQFFYGKRMDVQHFRMEQDYGRLKQSLLNRLTVGSGVLCGLRVVLDDGRLYVDPGVAIDGLGREIVVPVRSCVDLAASGDACCGGATAVPESGQDRRGFFTLWACYRECSADYQPVLASDCNTRAECSPGTTVETFCFKVTPGWGRYRTIRGGARKCDRAGSPAPRRASSPTRSCRGVFSPLRKLGGRRGWMRFARRYRAAVTCCALLPARPATYPKATRAFRWLRS